MPVYILNEKILFPDPNLADSSGLLAVGGDLSIPRLLAAYSNGIFPWYEEGMMLHWHSPDPRFVLMPEKLRINRSFRKAIKRFTVTFDRDFIKVIDFCAETPREGQGGTWITRDLRNAFIRLHEMGFAHSVESRIDGRLVGGIYGLSLGAAFFGESMFYHESNASKVALFHLQKRMEAWNFHFLDCQVYTEHMKKLGAEFITGEEFQRLLRKAMTVPTRKTGWT